MDSPLTPGPFRFAAPPAISFGRGTWRQLAAAVPGASTRVVVLHGAHWFARSEWAPQVAALLEPHAPLLMPVAAGEPTAASVQGVLAAARAAHADCLVGVGGGSVLDTAKAVAGMYHGRHQVADYLEPVDAGGEAAPLPPAALPWIALPTTGGTGAEATKNAVLKLERRGLKRSVRSERLLARAVIVDPSLAHGVGRRTTAMTGLDAVTQLVEAYVSRRRTRLAQSVAAGALAPLLSALRLLAADLDDEAGRDGAAYGALASGLALANSGLGAAHGFASGLGGLYDIPHGHICAAFLGPVCGANAAAIRASLGELLETAGLYRGADPVGWLSGVVVDLTAALGLEPDLTGYGVSSAQLDEIVSRSRGSSMAGNPVTLSIEQQRDLVARVVLGA